MPWSVTYCPTSSATKHALRRRTRRAMMPEKAPRQGRTTPDTSKRAAATHLCVPRPKAATHVTSTTSTTATAMPTHEGHSHPQQRTLATATRVARTSIQSQSGQSTTPQDCVNVFPDRSAAAADASASRTREKVASRAVVRHSRCAAQSLWTAYVRVIGRSPQSPALHGARAIALADAAVVEMMRRTIHTLLTTHYGRGRPNLARAHILDA